MTSTVSSEHGAEDTGGRSHFYIEFPCPWTRMYRCLFNGRDGTLKLIDECNKKDGLFSMFDYRLYGNRGELFGYGEYSPHENNGMKLAIHDTSFFFVAGSYITLNHSFYTNENVTIIEPENYMSSPYHMNINLVAFYYL